MPKTSKARETVREKYRENNRRFHRNSLERRALTQEDRRQKELLGFDDLTLFGIPYCRQHIYKLIKAGKFPKYKKIGDNRVAFLRDDIMAWIDKIKTA